tara:strand:- start:253 stop:387 length:135 start_codon:yes stop_codon:yes gene_type:complete
VVTAWMIITLAMVVLVWICPHISPHHSVKMDISRVVVVVVELVL